MENEADFEIFAHSWDFKEFPVVGNQLQKAFGEVNLVAGTPSLHKLDRQKKKWKTTGRAFSNCHK